MADRASRTWPGRRRQVRALHRRVRDAGHRPHPEVGRLRLRPLRPRAFRLRLRDGEERACAISRRPSCRRSCACPRKEYHHIARAMDMGAEGLMLPMVGNAEEARHIVNSMKYHPAGRRGVALQVAHDRYRPGLGRRQIRRRQQAHDASSARSRRRTASRTPTRSPRSTASTACGSAISTCRVSLGIPGEFDHPNFTDAIDKTSRPPRSTTRRSAAWCRPSSRASSFYARASISSAIRATSGCCTTRSAEAVAQAPRDGCEARKKGARPMADKFRVALSGDFKKADGSPTYPDFDLAPLARRARRRDGVPRIGRTRSRADQLEDFDALILLAHRFARGQRAEERPARRRRPLRRRLRHRRRRCLHARPASRW